MLRIAWNIIKPNSWKTATTAAISGVGLAYALSTQYDNEAETALAVSLAAGTATTVYGASGVFTAKSVPAKLFNGALALLGGWYTFAGAGAAG